MITTITGNTKISELYRSEDELTHHGVKGMKWGVRRYQNADGSLTNAGKKRAQKDAKKIANARARLYDSAKKVDKPIKKGKYINKALDKVTKAHDRSERLINKIKQKYANTALSDITITETARSGKIYTSVLMGRVGNSPYDGTPRYLVTAGTWTKDTFE